MAIEEGITERVRERLILPRPTSADYEQKDRIVGSGRGGLLARPAAVPAWPVAPGFPPDDKQQPPGGVPCLPEPFVERRQASSSSCMWLFLPIANSMYEARISTCCDTWPGLDRKPRSRQASPEGKAGHKIMDQCCIHGGSIPRWQSRLGEESCSYPRLPMATSVPPGGADGGGRRPGARSSTAQADISHSTANLAGCPFRSVSCDGASQVLP